MSLNYLDKYNLIVSSKTLKYKLLCNNISKYDFVKYCDDDCFICNFENLSFVLKMKYDEKYYFVTFHNDYNNYNNTYVFNNYVDINNVDIDLAIDILEYIVNKFKLTDKINKENFIYSNIVCDYFCKNELVNTDLIKNNTLIKSLSNITHDGNNIILLRYKNGGTVTMNNKITIQASSILHVINIYLNVYSYTTLPYLLKHFNNDDNSLFNILNNDILNYILFLIQKLIEQ